MAGLLRYRYKMTKKDKIAFIRCSNCILYKNLDVLGEHELDLLITEIVRNLRMESQLIANTYIADVMIFPN